MSTKPLTEGRLTLIREAADKGYTPITDADLFGLFALIDAERAKVAELELKLAQTGGAVIVQADRFLRAAKRAEVAEAEAERIAQLHSATVDEWAQMKSRVEVAEAALTRLGALASEAVEAWAQFRREQDGSHLAKVIDNLDLELNRLDALDPPTEGEAR